MSFWTKQKDVPHPCSPIVNVTKEVPSGKVVTQSQRVYLQRSSRQFSRDTSFKMYKNMLEEGRLSRLNPEQKRFLESWDYGTPFTVEHMFREPAAAQLSAYRERLFNGSGTSHRFTGPWHVGLSNDSMSTLVRTNVSWPQSGSVEDQELFALGGTAIARTIPTRSTSSLGVALVELLREGVPSIIGAQLKSNGMNSKAAGGEYLNYQFGWAPLVRDIVSVLDTVRRSAEILEEYHRLSGQHIRRRYEFPVQTSVDTFTGPNILGADNADTFLYKGATGARPEVVRTMKTETWFSGAYRYHLPYGDDFLSKLRVWEAEANKLLGLRLTPELLWNVTPWTWLSDWFVSLGDVMTNISHIGRDGLTLHYGYIMRTTTIEAEVRLPGVYLHGNSVECSERVKLVRKVRRRASPYGFGLTPEALTPKQWAILGALGATRAPGVGFNHASP